MTIPINMTKTFYAVVENVLFIQTKVGLHFIQAHFQQTKT